MQAHAKFTTIAWHRLLRSGDWGMLGVSALLVGGLFSQFWSKQVADVVVVRAGGKVVAELPLRHNRLLAVRGALAKRWSRSVKAVSASPVTPAPSNTASAKAG